MADKGCSFAANGNRSPFATRTAPPTKAKVGKKKLSKQKRRPRRGKTIHEEVRDNVNRLFKRGLDGR